MKNRNVFAQMLSVKTGSFRGKHKNKGLRGSGKVGGKRGRYAKHKKKINFE
jgi:hypothetical protein